VGLVAGSIPQDGDRQVFDMNFQKQPLPGNLVRSEGQPIVQGPSGSDANPAYDNSGICRDFFNKVLQRNSIDDEGMTLISSVRFDVDFENAYWNGSQMVYGAPDKTHPKITLGNFAHVLDVIGHEMSHGVVQFTDAQFIYAGEPGALNESVADCFGVTIKHWHNNHSASKADWTIGKGSILADSSIPLRDMSDPSRGYDPQPRHMKDYLKVPFNIWFTRRGDNGGVHKNSGIPNHAYYLLCTSLDGNSWDQPILIWYFSINPKKEWKLQTDLGKMVQVKNEIGRWTTFDLFGKRTVEVAGLLYTPAVQAAVLKAWQDVGVLQ